VSINIKKIESKKVHQKRFLKQKKVVIKVEIEPRMVNTLHLDVHFTAVFYISAFYSKQKHIFY